MNELITLNDSSLNKNQNHEENNKIFKNHQKLEKVLCHHCGRTKSNGKRCLGICVADSDY